MTTPIDFSTSPEEAVVWTQLSREFATRLERCWIDVCRELKIDLVRGITSPLICRAHIVLSLLVCPHADTGALFEAWMAKWKFPVSDKEHPYKYMMSCCEVRRFASIFRMLKRPLLPFCRESVYFGGGPLLHVHSNQEFFGGLSYSEAQMFARQCTNVFHSLRKTFDKELRIANPNADKEHKCPPADVCDESLISIMLTIFSGVSCETYMAALVAMRDKMRAAMLSSPVPDIDHIGKCEIASEDCAPKFLKSIWTVRAGFAGQPHPGKVTVLWTVLLSSFFAVNYEDASAMLAELNQPSVASRATAGSPGKVRLQRSSLHGFSKRPRAAKTQAVKLTRQQVLALKESKKDSRKVRPLRVKLHRKKKSEEPEDGESLGSEDTDEEEPISEHESDAEFICDDEEEESHYSSEESEASAEESEEEPPKKKRKAKN